MATSPSRSYGLVLTIWACSLAFLVGCGTYEYNQLIGQRIVEMRVAGPFRTLFGPTTLEGTPIKLRVPLMFPHSFVESSAHPEDGAKISPDRLQPPFLPLPGFKVCYEGSAQDPSGKVPYYCYLAATRAKPGDAAKLESELQARLKEKFKETPDAWETVDAQSPDGKALSWKRIIVTADQPFRFKDATANGELVSKDLPGIFELWMYDANDYVVLVGWRTPSAINGPVPPPPTDKKQAAAMAKMPAVTKPDLSTMPALTAGSLIIDAAAAPPASG